MLMPWPDTTTAAAQDHALRYGLAALVAAALEACCALLLLSEARCRRHSPACAFVSCSAALALCEAALWLQATTGCTGAEEVRLAAALQGAAWWCLAALPLVAAWFVQGRAWLTAVPADRQPRARLLVRLGAALLLVTVATDLLTAPASAAAAAQAAASPDDAASAPQPRWRLRCAGLGEGGGLAVWTSGDGAPAWWGWWAAPDGRAQTTALLAAVALLEVEPARYAALPAFLGAAAQAAPVLCGLESGDGLWWPAGLSVALYFVLEPLCCAPRLAPVARAATPSLVAACVAAALLIGALAVSAAFAPPRRLRGAGESLLFWLAHAEAGEVMMAMSCAAPLLAVWSAAVAAALRAWRSVRLERAAAPSLPLLGRGHAGDPSRCLAPNTHNLPRLRSAAAQRSAVAPRRPPQPPPPPPPPPPPDLLGSDGSGGFGSFGDAPPLRPPPVATPQPPSPVDAFGDEAAVQVLVAAEGPGVEAEAEGGEWADESPQPACAHATDSAAVEWSDWADSGAPTASPRVTTPPPPPATPLPAAAPGAASAPLPRPFRHVPGAVPGHAKPPPAHQHTNPPHPPTGPTTPLPPQRRPPPVSGGGRGAWSDEGPPRPRANLSSPEGISRIAALDAPPLRAASPDGYRERFPARSLRPSDLFDRESPERPGAAAATKAATTTTAMTTCGANGGSGGEDDAQGPLHEVWGGAMEALDLNAVARTGARLGARPTRDAVRSVLWRHREPLFLTFCTHALHAPPSASVAGAVWRLDAARFGALCAACGVLGAAEATELFAAVEAHYTLGAAGARHAAAEAAAAVAAAGAAAGVDLRRGFELHPYLHAIIEVAARRGRGTAGGAAAAGAGRRVAVNSLAERLEGTVQQMARRVSASPVGPPQPLVLGDGVRAAARGVAARSIFAAHDMPLRRTFDLWEVGQPPRPHTLSLARWHELIESVQPQASGLLRWLAKPHITAAFVGATLGGGGGGGGGVLDFAQFKEAVARVAVYAAGGAAVSAGGRPGAAAAAIDAQLSPLLELLAGGASVLQGPHERRAERERQEKARQERAQRERVRQQEQKVVREREERERREAEEKQRKAKLDREREERFTQQLLEHHAHLEQVRKEKEDKLAKELLKANIRTLKNRAAKREQLSGDEAAAGEGDEAAAGEDAQEEDAQATAPSASAAPAVAPALSVSSPAASNAPASPASPASPAKPGKSGKPGRPTGKVGAASSACASPGTAKRVHSSHANPHHSRHKAATANYQLIQGFDIDEDSHVSATEQLRDALAKHAVRVVDLFHEWDDDESGTVSRAEFRQGMEEMKFHAPQSELDALFDEWDANGSGHIELVEMQKLLRRGAAASSITGLFRE